MENNGGGEDDDGDQGSGWLEVKRKHRINSKLSTQNVPGASSSKTQFTSRHRPGSLTEEVENSRGRQRQQCIPPKSGPASAASVGVSSHVSSSTSKEAGKDEECLDKQVINQEVRRPEDTMNLDAKTALVLEVPQNENLNVVPRIKWGDLEDVALTLHECSGIFSSTCKAKHGDDTPRKGASLADADDSNQDISSHAHLKQDKRAVSSEDKEQFPDGIHSSSLAEESFEGNWKEVNVISSEGVELLNTCDLGKTFVECSMPSRYEGGGSLISKDIRDNSSTLSAEGMEKMMSLDTKDEYENGAVNIGENEISTINKKTDSIDISGSVTRQNQEDANQVAVVASSAMEESQGLQCGAENMVDLAEGELGESKERFRKRLWCFLFENLNRAVDELYLLCELECDMEQIEEAILVLNESASDFKELRSRVEGFDNTKRSSTQTAKDEILMTVKADRRPHALSWEVRRMTTSPHRADILSSSLEAFKRIQLERAGKHVTGIAEVLNLGSENPQVVPNDCLENRSGVIMTTEQGMKSRRIGAEAKNDKQIAKTNNEKENVQSRRISESSLEKDFTVPPESLATAKISEPLVDDTVAVGRSCRKELLQPLSQTERELPRKDKMLHESRLEKHSKPDLIKRQTSLVDKEKEKKTSTTWKSMDAWKEKRNWEDILKSPLRNTSKVSHSPGIGRKNGDRVRNLHDKLMSPEKKKKNALDMKREAEEKHARAMRIRNQLENERVQRLQRTSEKLNRVNEWQAVRSLKLREGMYARHQRSESRHEAHLAQVAKRAGDESSKVNEVRFITSLNEGNKKLMLRQKLHDSELRRAEKLQVMRTKQREDTAKEEAALERRKLLEAEKLHRLAETQRKKEEAQIRREEERKACSAAREARAVEQLRRKEVRAKAQQEEAELLAQKLAEKLSESEQRRKFYLEQIRERASMDFRDQSSPLLRRSLNKDGQSRSASTNNVEDYQVPCTSGAGGSSLSPSNVTQQPCLKRRVKKIRQRLMALKHEFIEPTIGAENAGLGCRALIGAAKTRIGRWLQELQRLRQARKEGSASIGLIVGDMIKFLEGKELELHASRQAGLIDFIASALPASHSSRPDASHVTVYLLCLLRVVLSVPANRSYFLSQNLLPPIIPMLSASLENYIKRAASSNLPGNNNLMSNKISAENLDSVSEILEGFLWTVTIIIGHVPFEEQQHQMQDGLTELIVAYRVIHHLRDLFALYDRPQIEGSPFPSVIISSLNLLTVLTSRSATISSIDWESHLSRSKSSSYIHDIPVPKNLESLSLLDSSTMKFTSGDCKLPMISHVTEKLLDGASLSNIPEDKQLDVICRKDPVISPEVGSAIDNIGTSSVTKVSLNEGLLEEQSKLSPQENKNTSLDKDVEINSISEPVARATDGSVKQPEALLIATIGETGLVSLPSLLTAVLLQANNRLSSEQTSCVLPSNFEEVATGVLKILNNLALLDITFLQNMLARTDLKMEFFHLMSFLLSHCTSKWKAANDQVGLLLLESLVLLGYFALFRPGNQAVLRWGKSPTILHKICDLPFVFFSDPELTPILAGTLVAACYECEQNRGVIQQELSMDMFLSLLKSCREELLNGQPDSLPPDNAITDDAFDNTKTFLEIKRSQGDFCLRPNRKNTRNMSNKGVSICNSRSSKSRFEKDCKLTKSYSEWASKHDLRASRSSSTFMLHGRFPSTFLDKAEEFFSVGIPIFASTIE